MIRKTLSMVVLIAVAAFIFGGAAGCEDDVKKTSKIEQTKESDPQMVSPGEPVVE
ncbi:MAG: hypothetical protein ACYSUQ_09090 [Planctomycetota bacterium]|jgi:hypothetical protein